MLDVSTLKELALRWAPQLIEDTDKQGCHRALQDVRDSIAELRHYRAYFLALKPFFMLKLFGFLISQLRAFLICIMLFYI